MAAGIATLVAIGIGLYALVEHKIKRALSADPPIASSYYGELFSSVPLSVLKRSRHDSIAIQAAWEEVRHTVPETEVPRDFRPDGQKLKQFLDVLERRGRVPIPEWWAEVVRGARARRRDSVIPGEPSSPPAYSKAGLVFHNASKEAMIRKERDFYMLRIGDDSFSIPSDVLKDWGDHPISYKVSGNLTSTHSFVAVHDTTGHSPDLACIDRTTGKTLWRSEACGCRRRNVFAVGRHNSWVDVVVQDDRVVVFGFSYMGFYAHGFRIDNGETLFRFASSF